MDGRKGDAALKSIASIITAIPKEQRKGTEKGDAMLRICYVINQRYSR